ncbi:hypothetical protein ACVWZA_002934 [Sphingomonas sp. UYAg733]
MARKIVLESPLDPVALATRLKTVLGGRDGQIKAAGVTGQGTDQSMMLFYFRPNIQNSFATNLTATMAAAGGGTRIAGRIGTPRSAGVFMGCWFGFLTVFLALAGGGMAVAGESFGAAWPLMAIPLGMMAFGGLLYRVGTWTAKRDEAAILAFLADTVSARPAA